MKTTAVKSNATAPAPATLTVALDADALTHALADALGDVQAKRLIEKVRYRLRRGFKRRDLPGQLLLFKDIDPHMASQ